jgi:uroporphyrinogen decarboxylase
MTQASSDKSSHRFLQAAWGQATEQIPVWLMRQAGRILPQYRALRAEAGSFKALVSNPDWVCEVTLQPVDELNVDAAILFSDILVIPEAMGLAYEMQEGKGPRFPKPLRSMDDLRPLKVAEPRKDLDYVLEGLKRTRAALADRKPLIGFAGAPWTVFAYMVEGSGSKTYSHARAALRAQPDFANTLLDMITESTIAYLQAKVEAGAQAIQLFDSHAGVLDRKTYQQHCIPRLRKICEAVPDVPLIVFAKDGHFALEDLGTLPCQVLGLDWTIEPSKAAQLAGTKVFQGNLDPAVLYMDHQDIIRETHSMLDQFSGAHIANLGHGVYPDTPLEGVRTFVQAVQSYRRK